MDYFTFKLDIDWANAQPGPSLAILLDAIPAMQKQ